MAFEWHKIHKFEDSFEREIKESVTEYVLEYYEVESIEDLTQENVAEITEYIEAMNPYSIMRIGFTELLNDLENLDG